MKARLAFIASLILIFLSITDKDQKLNNFQLWNQCDPRWAHDKIGTSNQTICQYGNLVTTVTMAVASIPFWVDPGQMNEWLKKYSGYVNGSQYVWQSIRPFGLNFGGFEKNSSLISNHLRLNRLVLINIHNQTHWALATSIDVKSDIIYINDPIKNATTEKVSNIRQFGWYERLKSNNILSEH